MTDGLTDSTEMGATEIGADASLSFDRFWRQFWKMSFRSKRLTVTGLLRYLWHMRKFDSRQPIVISRGVVIGKEGRGRLIAGRGARISYNCVLVVGDEGLLSIGPRTIIGPHTRIMAATEVKIGARCMLSWNCSIFDSIGHRLWLENTGEAKIEAPVTIEDDVWIGPYTIIMKGVTVGSGSVIGAGSVIRRSIPAKSLAYGNPARVVGKVVRWER